VVVWEVVWDAVHRCCERATGRFGTTNQGGCSAPRMSRGGISSERQGGCSFDTSPFPANVKGAFPLIPRHPLPE